MTDDELQRVANQLRDAAEDAGPRADCPSAERIWTAVKLAGPRDERLAILDHTLACPACAEAWRIAMALGGPAASGRRPSSPRLAAVLASRAEGPPLGSIHWPAALTGARIAAAALVAIAGVVYLMTRGATPRVDTLAQQTDARPASAIVVSLNDGGGRVTLADDGTLTTPTPLSGNDAARVKRVLQTQKLATPAPLAALRTGSGTLMGSGDAPVTARRTESSAPRGSREASAFALVTAVATVVESDRPTLVWHALPGAVSYEVTISDVAANYREFVSSPPLRETSWTVTRALTRGRVYSWQVVARTPAGEVKAPAANEGEARFKVLTQEDADTMAKTRKLHRGGHLVLGVLYAEAGLVDEADGEFRALAEANPDSSVARELLRAVRELRLRERLRTIKR